MGLKDMVSAILATGLSEAELAIKIGVSQPTVNRIKKGSQNVGYETGKKIELVYVDIFEKQKAA